MADAVPNVRLNSGYVIPQLGLGTFLSDPGKVGAAVEMALEIGYRHIDCAWAYLNQKEIGSALSRAFAGGKVTRDQLFITSKIWNTQHSYPNAKKAIDTILEELQVDYVDLCLIHWPMGYKEDCEPFPFDSNGKMQYSNFDYLDTWRAMEEAVKDGKIRSLGMSNFNHKQIERIRAIATIKPAVLQLEIHPYLRSDDVFGYCAKNDMIVTAYSPLAAPAHKLRKEGQPLLLEEKLMKDIALKHNKSAAQVAIRWTLQRGAVAIPKSVTRERLRENFDVFDFTLTDAEMTSISALNRDLRITDISQRDSGHPHFPFNDGF